VLVRDGVVFTVVGVLVYKINDAYKALFDIADLQEALRDVGSGKLREVVSTRSSDEMGDIGALRAAVMEKLRDQEEQWGVHVIDFLLVNVEPSPAAQQLFLLEELARRRVDAAEVTLQGFQRLAADIGLPPRPDSPLWAALAGMSVTAATLSDSSPSNAVAGESSLDAARLQEEAKKLRGRLESMDGNG
jgi:regulator of protease activity HflC (stomatin/prohibitin superfamily)